MKQSKVGSSFASKRTLQRRAASIRHCRETVSGGGVQNTEKQQETEIKMMGKEQRQKILREAGITLEVTAEDGIAMKTELGVTWNKIRHRGLECYI